MSIEIPQPKGKRERGLKMNRATGTCAMERNGPACVRWSSETRREGEGAESHDLMHRSENAGLANSCSIRNGKKSHWAVMNVPGQAGT